MPDAKATPEVPAYAELEFVEGMYCLMNKETRRVVDLHRGDPGQGTPCHGCPPPNAGDFTCKFWRIRKDGVDETYTIRNLRSGTFLDLSDGKKEDGSPVKGYGRAYASDTEIRGNAEWSLKVDATGYYIVRCRRTGTCLQQEEGKQDGALIVCSAFVEGKNRQLWDLTRVSRSSEEIISIIGDWKESLLGQLCQTYPSDAQYVVMPHQLRKEIWERTGLRDTHIQQYTFDYDDFVVKMKDAVSTWARQEYRLHGVAILFGIIYGRTNRGPCAFNWYLSADLHTLMFFDAQTGYEYTCAALDARGFQPSFATF